MSVAQSKILLQTLGLSPFVPHRLAPNGWTQTILARYWPEHHQDIESGRYKVDLEDGDQLVLHENRPHLWQEGQRIVLLVHGLAGSYQSNYMQRLARKFSDLGILVLRMNHRNCGPGFGLAQRPYHSGRSEDTRSILNFIAVNYPNSPVTQIGFSLGGNVTLKMLGEGNVPSNIDSAVAVSVPLDLSECARVLSQPANLIFDQYFVIKLRREIYRLHEDKLQTPSPKFPLRMKLTDFDEYYTAPRSGFKDAQDYYHKASSGPFVKNIEIPTLVLHAVDDPIVGFKAYLNLEISSTVDLLLTEKGGHVGFLHADQHQQRWMDEAIFAWMKYKNLI